MARLLITTVGLSLLTNRDERPWNGWNGRAGDPLPDAAEVDPWLEAADPTAASAETNTLRSIEVESADHVLLLHSDTDEGRFCSDRLRRFYSDVVECRQVDARPLTALGYAGASFSEKGLKVLVHEATAAVRGAGRLDPVFCATGGFKAEIAFLNLLGALLGVEVFYIHEQFREVVRLPRLPLDWDTNFVLEPRQRHFFDWIKKEPRSSAEVAGRLKGENPELQPLIEDVEGYSRLNAAGELLYQAALTVVGRRVDWPPSAPLSPSDKNGLSGEGHHRARGWKAFVERLCNVNCVKRVSFDKATSRGPAVKVLCASTGAIGVRWGPEGHDSLPLRVETTAQGDAQTELVKKHIEKLLRG